MTSPAAAQSAGSQPSAARTLAAIGLTTVTLWIALYLIVYALVPLLLGNWLGLVFAGLAFVGTVAVVALLIRVATGRARVGAALGVSAAAVISLIISFLNSDSFPVTVLASNFGLAVFLDALASAALLGLFLGPWWMRIVGGPLGIVFAGFWILAVAPEAPPAPEPASLDEQYASFKEQHSSTLVSDVPGSTIVSLESFGSPAQISWIRTADNGVLEITNNVYAPPEDIAHVFPCWMISDNNMNLLPTDEIADYSAWCVPDAEGWARTDHLGFARLLNGNLMSVRSVDVTQIGQVGDPDGRPASAAEVSAALAALRPITEDELRTVFLKLVNPDDLEPAP